MAPVLSIFQFSGTMDTRSKPIFLLLGNSLLFLNMFVCPHLALFASVSLCMLPLSLLYILCLPVGLFPLLLHVHAWSKGCLEQRHDLLGASKEGHTLRMLAYACFTFLPCMIALCMMYVCVYVCVCIGDHALCMMDSRNYVSNPL